MPQRSALVFGLALILIACGDDTDDVERDAGHVVGGKGGRGSTAGRGGTADIAGTGGIGGYGGSSSGGAGAQRPCREGKLEELAVWCSDPNHECGLSLAERWQRSCNKTDCTRDCYSSSQNSCGGYSISHVLGIDVYSETHYYDEDEVLVGVSVHPFSYPCGMVRDRYGRQCEYAASGELSCDAADAGSE
jgi:hypothetical protein